MLRLPFVKVEGLGNDFVLLDRLDRTPAAVADELALLRAHAPRLCDRRRGIGADGVLLVCAGEHPSAAATMLVINFDGSRPQMCGNGLRCVAQHVHQRTGKTAFTVATDAGDRLCEVTLDPEDADAAGVRVEMGTASSRGELRPSAGGGRPFHGVSVGNPHAICFVDPHESASLAALAAELGPLVEVDPLFPERTNVEFAALDASGVRLVVWERGCGLTQACGTGACATVAAAVWADRLAADTPVRVHLPGGELEVRCSPDGRLELRGPCRRVFRGTVEIAACSS